MHPSHQNLHSTQRGAASKALLYVGAIVVLAGAIAVLAFDRIDGGTEPAAVEPDETRVQPDDTPVGGTDEPIPATLPDGLQPALGHISRGRFMEARAAIALFQKDHDPCVQCEFLHGLSYHKEKRYEQARPYLEAAIEMNDNYPPAWYFYGWCLYYLGDHDASRAAFETHIALDPLEGDSEYGLGLIEMDAGNLEEAEARFRTSIELQENNPRRLREVAKAHARLGDIFALRDELEDAKEQLRLATDIWPGHYEAHFKLARVLYRLGEDEAAEVAMEKYEIGKRRVEGTLELPEPPAESGEHKDAPSAAEGEP